MNEKCSAFTYISLFSSAGIGCYGFLQEKFQCVATNELIPRRLEIQKFNHKCKYPSGYICGDITQEDTKKLLLDEIALWERKENIQGVDVIIATPPCQGMSVANHKKSSNEICRNSLVIESIKLILQIHPRFFIFENVPAFMKTPCVDVDGEEKSISDAIKHNLGEKYSYVSRVVNFKNLGACSSRQRTLVIGVARKYADDISPYELYPEQQKEKTLREVIGDLPTLHTMGEVFPLDIYHAFRPYPAYMREWISSLREGESAFDNGDEIRRPHQIVDGKIIPNKNKNGDKYRRQFWDKTGPCVHTRNDQLASQNTIHPSDDRVFSIRELMRMMTVPDDFCWTECGYEALNHLPIEEKTKFLKKAATTIRQSLGEAVPTVVFRTIARKIKYFLTKATIDLHTADKYIAERNLCDSKRLEEFIEYNPENLSIMSLSRIAELANTNRTENAAFYTNKSLITEIVKYLPDFDKDEITILEPSSGVGNFIPLLWQKYEGKKLVIDLVDIDKNSITIARTLLKKYKIPTGCSINYIVDDFLLHCFEKKYDLIVGNPPFAKITGNAEELSIYKRNAINKKTSNICSFFLDKAIALGNNIALVFPKFLLNTPEFATSRSYLKRKAVETIIDFGESGFPGVLIETIAIFISNDKKPNITRVVRHPQDVVIEQKQEYIFDENLPYWIIYRNEMFDQVCRKLDFNLFSVFRDRQITNKHLTNIGEIRVLKSRNISDDGTCIKDIDGYDSYISTEDAKKMAVYRFLNDDSVFLTPNMTYNPRVIKKTAGVLVNGSVAILIPKSPVSITKEQLAFFSSEEYRVFYRIARNFQTRSLNVDASSVFFFGLLRETPKKHPIERPVNEIIQPSFDF